ncbi:bacillithiol system redox-active protein YtxJ [bacterium]|nr:bacillithiol system redox-active protein YtxJ [bacterium]
MLKPLSSVSEVLEASRTAPTLVFKNSRTCPISAEARHQLETWAAVNSRPDVYMLTVQENRDLSVELSDRLDVEHETPQLLLLHNRKVLGQLSHYSIKRERIEKLLTDRL